MVPHLGGGERSTDQESSKSLKKLGRLDGGEGEATSSREKKKKPTKKKKKTPRLDGKDKTWVEGKNGWCFAKKGEGGGLRTRKKRPPVIYRGKTRKKKKREKKKAVPTTPSPWGGKKPNPVLPPERKDPGGQKKG